MAAVFDPDAPALPKRPRLVALLSEAGEPLAYVARRSREVYFPKLFQNPEEQARALSELGAAGIVAFVVKGVAFFPVSLMRQMYPEMLSQWEAVRDWALATFDRAHALELIKAD
jgi:hypothetical protein